jgi:hypothetical protein
VPASDGIFRDRSAAHWIGWWSRRARGQWPGNPIQALAIASYALLDLLPPASILWRTTHRIARRSLSVDAASVRADAVLQWYVLLTLGISTAGLLLAGDAVHEMAAVLGVVRLVDLLPVFMGILLFQGTGERTGLRISVAAVYLAQIVLAYACISQAWLAHDLLAPCVLHGVTLSRQCSPTGGVEHLYVAVTNMFTLGNDYAPTTTASRIVTALEPLTGVIFAGAVLAEILGHERDRAPVPG